MKKLYLILSFFISISSFASVLTCSKNGTALLFVNGVNTTPTEAQDNAIRTWALGSEAQLDVKPLLRDYYYNRSAGILKDFTESGVQVLVATYPILGAYKIWSHFLRFGNLPSNLGSSATVAIINQRLREVQNGFIFNNLLFSYEQDTIGLTQKIGSYLSAERKVLLVSHSQGNFFANFAYTTLQQSDVSSKLKFYANFQVAPPTSEILSKGLYIKLLDDVIVVPVINSLPGNYSQVSPDWSIVLPSGKVLSQDSVHHNFLDTYTSENVFGDGIHVGTMNYIFKKTMFDVAATLESNCDDIQACDGAPGTSPQPKVFVANTARLYAPIFVSPMSPYVVEICEGAHVYGNATISGKVKITGSAQVQGSANLNGFGSGLEISGTAEVMGRVEAYGELVIKGSTKIYEGASVFGKGTFDGDTEIGSSEVTLDGTHVYDSQIFNSKVYAESYVSDSTIFNSDVKASSISNSTIEMNSKIDASFIESSTVSNSKVFTSGVSMSTITNNSTIMASSYIDTSNIDSSTITSESSIFESTLIGKTCSGAFMFSNSGEGCSPTGSSSVPLLP